MANVPAYGDMRIAPSLVRPHRVEVHVWDFAPTPERGGWIYAGEFDSVTEAQAWAAEADPEAALTIEI